MSKMRELTSDEQARLLTQEEVDALPEDTEVMVKWTGGNGPHRYKIARRNGTTFAELITCTAVCGGDRRLVAVGNDRCHDRVFLHSDNVLSVSGERKEADVNK
jgi:hypothetical protein